MIIHFLPSFLLGIAAGLIFDSIQDFRHEISIRKRCDEIKQEINLHNENLSLLDNESKIKEIETITTLKTELKILSE